MSPSILFNVVFFLIITVNTKTRIIKDETDGFGSALLCGSEVMIKHRASDLCLSMTKNKNHAHLMQIGLENCYEFDTNQRWILHCCDPYMLRCGKYNPFRNEGDSITYSDYFQIQQKESKLCISTANIWDRDNDQNSKSVYLQECQGSLVESMDSVQSTKIQRDKFLFNDGEDYTNTKVHTDHFTFLINLFIPLCLGHEQESNSNDKLLARGYVCNVHRENTGSIQFKFIALMTLQTNDVQFDEL